MSRRAGVVAADTRVKRTKNGSELRYGDQFDLEILGEPPQPWRVRLTLGKQSGIVCQPKKGNLQLDTGGRGPGARVSTGCSDIQSAIAYAEEYLGRQHIAVLCKQGVNAAAPAATGNLTLGEVIQLCRHYYLNDHFAGNQDRQWKLEFIFACVLELFGSTYPVRAIGNRFVQHFISERTTRELVIRRSEGGQIVPPCQPVTALMQIMDFASAVRYLKNKVETADGRDLLLVDPFEKVQWPRGQEYEKRLLEPCCEDLYAWLMSPYENPRDGTLYRAPVDVVDPTGKLRWWVATLYFTGHRRAACTNLFAHDVLTDVADILARLRAAGGAARTKWAKLFAVSGAIWMDRKYSKGRYSRLIPMSTGHRAEWNFFTTRHGPWKLSDPLVPSPDDSTRRISYSALLSPPKETRGRPQRGGLYVQAIDVVRSYLTLDGRDPDEIAPIAPGELVHGWRRCFATRVERLGWGRKVPAKGGLELDRHANYLAGWSILGGGIREERYVRLDGEILVAIVEGRPASEVLQLRGDQAAAEQALLLERASKGRSV